MLAIALAALVLAPLVVLVYDLAGSYRRSRT
jgi:hypothetical protein